MKQAALVVLVVVGVFIAVIWAFQRRLIYFPSGAPVPRAHDVIDGAREVTLETSDGLSLEAWFVQAPGQPNGSVLVANGNAGDRSLRAPLAEALAEEGFAVLLFDYRGYGGNPGHPSEDGLALDARAAYRFVIEDQGVERKGLIYFGESLGAAVVSELATEHPPGGLLLRSPFTSLADVGRMHYPFLPVGALLRDRYPEIAQPTALDPRTTHENRSNDGCFVDTKAPWLTKTAANRLLEEEVGMVGKPRFFFTIVNLLVAINLLSCSATSTRPSDAEEERSSAPPTPIREVAEIVAQIRVGKDPWGVAAGYGGVWVSEGRSVSRLDPQTNEVAATIPLPGSIAGQPTVPGDSHTLNWAAVGAGSVWVAVAGKDLSVVRIDPKTNKVLATIPVGAAPERPTPIVVGEGGVWVTNFAESTVSRIDPRTDRVVATIKTSRDPLFGSPSGVATTPGAVWVMNHASAELLRIDPRTNRVVAKVSAGASGRVDSGEGSVWVASAGENFVERIDPDKNRVVATISGCSSTQDLAFGAGYVWVTGASGVCRIDPDSNKATYLPLETTTTTLAFESGDIWVTSLERRRVLRVEPSQS